MKLGVIGLGYWGKILYKTLAKIDAEIVTCDPINKEADFSRYEDLDKCDKVFVVTPVSSHSEVCRYFISKGIDIFCEKPLVMSSIEAIDLYNLARVNSCNLFVDWVFTYNNQVNLIKQLIHSDIATYGALKSISMNRQNFGPVRDDVTAKYDLASHDISIAIHLLNSTPDKINWIGYKRNKYSNTNDSCHGLMQFKDVTVQVNASWHYGKKDRLCIFEFEKGFLIWEDDKSRLEFNDINLFEEGLSPLENSVNSFLKGENNMELTLKTLQVLEHENSF
jgi:UDP-N-acetylglucosamine 3-dehydrogenase